MIGNQLHAIWSTLNEGGRGHMWKQSHLCKNLACLIIFVQDCSIRQQKGKIGGAIAFLVLSHRNSMKPGRGISFFLLRINSILASKWAFPDVPEDVALNTFLGPSLLTPSHTVFLCPLNTSWLNSPTTYASLPNTHWLRGCLPFIQKVSLRAPFPKMWRCSN